MAFARVWSLPRPRALLSCAGYPPLNMASDARRSAVGGGRAGKGTVSEGCPAALVPGWAVGDVGEVQWVWSPRQARQYGNNHTTCNVSQCRVHKHRLRRCASPFSSHARARREAALRQTRRRVYVCTHFNQRHSLTNRANTSFTLVGRSRDFTL